MQKNKPLTIANQTIQPGENKVIKLPSATLYTHTPMDIPVHVFHGKQAGKRLFVTAAIHGDEINGVEIIRRLHKQRSLKKLAGTLITVPIVNAHGFILQSRYLPDRRDLNRAFPGSKKGSLAARLANILLKEIIEQCDYGIDLHTGSIHRTNLPQIRFLRDNVEADKLALAFNAPVMLPSHIREGSLRDAATKLGIPVLVYEAGEALRFDESSIRIGVKGILNTLHHLGCLPPIKTVGSRRYTKSVRLESSQWLRAPLSGMNHHLKKLGSIVKQSMPVAAVVDPFGETFSKITAPFDGMIIGYNQLPLINEGDALIHIACTEKMKQLSELSDEWLEEQNSHGPEQSL